MECYDVMRMGMEMIQRIPEVRTAGMSNEEGCVMIGKVLGKWNEKNDDRAQLRG
jgi:hypothetical protein